MEEVEEVGEVGEVCKDKELIGRDGYDTVDAAGRRSRGGAEEQGGWSDKAPAEDRGVIPEGQGEGRSPREVGGRARPSILLNSTTYANIGGGGARICGRQPARLRRSP